MNFNDMFNSMLAVRNYALSLALPESNEVASMPVMNVASMNILNDLPLGGWDKYIRSLMDANFSFTPDCHRFMQIMDRLESVYGLDLEGEMWYYGDSSIWAIADGIMEDGIRAFDIDHSDWAVPVYIVYDPDSGNIIEAGICAIIENKDHEKTCVSASLPFIYEDE